MSASKHPFAGNCWPTAQLAEADSGGGAKTGRAVEHLHELRRIRGQANLPRVLG
jgi:hypothetical protein